MSDTIAFIGADVHDGVTLHQNAALVCSHGTRAVMRAAQIPADADIRRLRGGVICPAFVDLQVNGGGGVIFNDAQTPATLQTMADAHARLGTGMFLPTLITDTPDHTERAIAAVAQAGMAGIHLEGPHLSVARKGAHDGTLIRPMKDADLAVLLHAKTQLAHVKVTVAPENVTLAQIKAMHDAGIVVALGHTDAGYAQCMAAFDAGARCVTHLFNAMSQMTNRAPGLVGAALSRDEVYVGVIADGIHVHPASLAVALSAPRAKDRIFLVTDAMAPAGTDMTAFTLNGRRIDRTDGRLTLSDGTLAGADLDLTTAIDVTVRSGGATLETAIAMATSVPAALLGAQDQLGNITAPSARVLHLQTETLQPGFLDF
ncbi:MAG: N-acetylglucosamine-6-phosphate deacetylase [Yoonia sp.]